MKEIQTEISKYIEFTKIHPSSQLRIEFNEMNAPLQLHRYCSEAEVQDYICTSNKMNNRYNRRMLDRVLFRLHVNCSPLFVNNNITRVRYYFIVILN